MGFHLPFLPAKKRIGLTIDDDGLRYIETSHTKGEIQIHQIGMIPLDRGIMAAGKVVDQEALELQLSLAKKDLRLSGKKVSLAVPSSVVVIRMLSLPPLPEREIRSLIEVELESSIHLPFSRPYFDYYKLPQGIQIPAVRQTSSVEEAPEELEDHYLVIAAPGDLIDQYVALLKLLNLDTVSVDIEPLALYRILALSGVSLSHDFLIVQLGLHSINVGIFQEDIPEFLRNIPLDLENYKIQADEKTLTSVELLQFLEQRNAFSSFAEDLARELERVINFYQFSLKNGVAKIERLYLTGDFPDIEKMVNYLRDRLPQLHIAQLPLEHIQHDPAHRPVLQAYSVALGLSLRG